MPVLSITKGAGFGLLLKRLADRIGDDMVQPLLQGGQLLETQIKANASGRPGPNVVTGNYRRSWNTQRVGSVGGGPAVSIGTNAPQGRRLEYGFRGADALGRTFNQPPYPHVEPAIASTEEAIVELLGDGIDVILNSGE